MYYRVIRLRSGTAHAGHIVKPSHLVYARLFVILDENTSVSSAVKQMQSHNADTIIVSRGNMLVGIVTDSDIIDKSEPSYWQERNPENLGEE